MVSALGSPATAAAAADEVRNELYERNDGDDAEQDPEHVGLLVRLQRLRVSPGDRP